MSIFRTYTRTSLAQRPLSLGFTSRKVSGLHELPVELHYERVNASRPSGIPEHQESGSLVICHGLFGSKQNWRSLSKTFAKLLNTNIYSLDLRNHGMSPHTETMDYMAMAADVLRFCQTHRLSNISLLGHSMGGKVAMAFALQPHLPLGVLSNLIVVDIAPSDGALSPEFRNYVDAMIQIERLQVRTRKEANDILQNIEKDASIRAFLLTNLISSPGDPLKFRVPMNVIKRSLDNLGSFPYEPGQQKWEGRTLLIKGAKSKYVNKNNITIAQGFFPELRLETLDTGHWVHAEEPYGFVDIVVDFVKSL